MVISWHADESSAPHDGPDPSKEEEPDSTDLEKTNPEIDAHGTHFAPFILTGVTAAEHGETSNDRSDAGEEDVEDQT